MSCIPKSFLPSTYFFGVAPTSPYILQIKMVLLLSDCKLLVDRVVSAPELTFLMSEKRAIISRFNFVWRDLRLVNVAPPACLFYFFWLMLKILTNAWTICLALQYIDLGLLKKINHIINYVDINCINYWDFVYKNKCMTYIVDPYSKCIITYHTSLILKFCLVYTSLFDSALYLPELNSTYDS